MGKLNTAGNTQALKDLLENAPIQGTSELINTPAAAGKHAENTKPAAGTKEEKILINFKLNKSTKELLQAYCDSNDMTLTAGIKKAIREMLQKENIL